MYMAGPLNVRMRDGHTETVEYDPLNPMDSTFQGRFAVLTGEGGIPLRSDGNPWAMAPATGGGNFWDGCPLNVAYEESTSHSRNTWLPSQIEVMRAAGVTPSCLVPGSPNYLEWFKGEGVVANSGTGTRTTYTPTTIMETQQPALLPTGLATPTIVPQPNGQTFFMPPEPATPDPALAEEEEGTWWPWLLAAAFILPKVAFVGYGGYKYVKYRQGKTTRTRKRARRR